MVGSTVFAVVLVLFALKHFLRGLRASGTEEIAKHFPAADVLRAETLAQSFGQRSKGVWQARGSGALALTPTELFFLLYLPKRALRISLSSITAVSLVRSHLGKTQFTDLLHVTFTLDGIEDAIAWRVPDPGVWKSQLDSRRFELDAVDELDVVGGAALRLHYQLGRRRPAESGDARTGFGLGVSLRAAAACALPALFLSLSCCSQGAEQGPPPQPKGASATTLPIPRELLRTVCYAAPCGGDAASVEVLRDASGQVKRLLRQYGACFHSPGIYFDETGQETELIPNQPVAMGSPEQRAFEARHEAQTKGLTRGEIIRCSDGVILPKR